MQQIDTLNTIGITDLIAENTTVLDQLGHLIDQLSRETFARQFKAPGNPTTGRHVRHILDHYTSFLEALKPDRPFLDYENRERNATIEHCPREARAKVSAICNDLKKLENTSHERPVRVHYLTGSGAIAIDSSAGRELTFLTGHTIHHMAIIALLVGDLHIELKDGFGVHPSTQRYQQQSAQHTAERGLAISG